MRFYRTLNSARRLRGVVAVRALRHNRPTGFHSTTQKVRQPIFSLRGVAKKTRWIGGNSSAYVKTVA
jgi:hypothetical protein